MRRACAAGVGTTGAWRISPARHPPCGGWGVWQMSCSRERRCQASCTGANNSWGRCHIFCLVEPGLKPVR